MPDSPTASAPTDFCCRDGCCGPGSWCCERAGEHDHGPEHEALYGSVGRVTTVVCTCEGFAATYGNEKAARLAWARHMEAAGV